MGIVFCKYSFISELFWHFRIYGYDFPNIQIYGYTFQKFCQIYGHTFQKFFLNYGYAFEEFSGFMDGTFTI